MRLQDSAQSSVESVPDRSSTGSSPRHGNSDALSSFSDGPSSSGDAKSQPTQCRSLVGVDVAAKNSNSNNEQCGLQVVATPTSLPSDTDSIRTFGSERTLVEASGSAAEGDGTGGGYGIVSSRRGLLTLPPTSHKQTCSSLDSEGLGSLASEEIEEAGPLDWAQWTKDVSHIIY